MDPPPRMPRAGGHAPRSPVVRAAHALAQRLAGFGQAVFAPHPLFAAAGAGVLCGATLPALRLGLHEAGPVHLALLRYAIAALCLLLVSACLRPARGTNAQGDWLPAALIDFGQFGVLIALLAFALRYTSASRAGLIFGCAPLFMLLLMTPAWQRRHGAMLVPGLALAALGVLLALCDGPYVRPARYAWIGELLVLLCAALGALCGLLCRPWLLRLPPLRVALCATAASALLLILLAGGGWTQGLHLSPRGWVIAAYLGVSCAAACLLWQYALARAPAARVLPFLACAPLAAAVLGAHSLGERHSGWILAGLVCVAAGLALALRAAPRLEDDGEGEVGARTAAAPPRPAPER